MTTRRRSSPLGRAWEIGCGVLRVGCNATMPLRFSVSVVEGRKESTTGAEGSFGRRAAEGLRVQVWPYIVFVLAFSSSSLSDSVAEEDDEDDAVSDSTLDIG